MNDHLNSNSIQPCPDYFVNGPVKSVEIISMVLIDSLNSEYSLEIFQSLRYRLTQSDQNILQQIM